MAQVKRRQLFAVKQIVKKDKTSSLKKRVLFFFGIVILILAVLIYFVRQERFLIDAITVDGVKTIPKDFIERPVREIISGDYFFIVPRASAFFYDRANIIASISKTFPEIKSVAVDLNSTDNNLSITIKERSPKYIWCRSVSVECYLADQDGIIYKKSPIFSRSPYPVFIGGYESDPTFKSASWGIKADELVDFSKKVKELSKIWIGDEGPRIMNKGDGDFEVQFESARIIYSKDISLENVLSRIEAIFSDSLFRARLLRSKLEYIDLRFGKKVYYRFTDEK